MRRETLLCIDDDPMGLTLRKMLLESAGYEVLCAGDGVSGLVGFVSHEVAAVVLDYNMPGMNGDEVARRMRQLKPRIPILLFTALPDLVDEVRGCADAFLMKGDSPRALFDEVERLIHTCHRHSEWDGDYIAFANAERRYVEVTDNLAMLLGYSREELLRMRIDDVVQLPEHVPELWSRYLQDGYQEGTINLRQREGGFVSVQYRAKVFPDGCMLSRMEPFPGQSGKREALAELNSSSRTCQKRP
jgi:CheY-like chemotaxis protein